MDIEDRAERWARDFARPIEPQPPGRQCGCPPRSHDINALIAAYLAGSAQTQADYTAAIPGAQDEGWRDYWAGKPGFRDGR